MSKHIELINEIKKRGHGPRSIFKDTFPTTPLKVSKMGGIYSKPNI